MKNERLNVKESIIGATIAAILFFKGWYWLETGQGYVNPIWMTVLVALQVVASIIVVQGLTYNACEMYFHERRKKKKVK